MGTALTFMEAPSGRVRSKPGRSPGDGTADQFLLGARQGARKIALPVLEEEAKAHGSAF